MQKDSAPELIGLLREAGLEWAITALKLIDQLDQNQAKNIHELRVVTKKLRAYWRILRPLLKDKTRYSVHNNLLSDTAKLLCRSRENYVNRKLIKSFKSGVRSHSQKLILDKLLALMPVEGEIEEPSKEKLKDYLAEEYQFWQEFDCNNLRADIIDYSGIVQSYKKAKKLGRKSVDNDLPTDVTHQWRKWSKYLLYQLEIVPLISHQNSISKYLQGLKKLTGNLGELHDLNVLQEIINDAIQNNLLEVDTDKIIRLIHKKKQILSKNCISYYDQLFSEKYPAALI